MESKPNHEQSDDASGREARRQLVESIYGECRNNLDLYHSPWGIDVEIGDINWTVTYWPSWTDAQGPHGEQLGLIRDSHAFDHPVAYRLGLDGTVTKNEGIEKRVQGGVYFDKTTVEPVEDTNEIELLHAIVVAAHTVHR